MANGPDCEDGQSDAQPTRRSIRPYQEGGPRLGLFYLSPTGSRALSRLYLACSCWVLGCGASHLPPAQATTVELSAAVVWVVWPSHAIAGVIAIPTNAKVANISVVFMS